MKNLISQNNKCTVCPRSCGADRTKTSGSCGAGEFARVARAALHMWEEPCISGKYGSGTVFFSGCSLRCVFCQNHEISHSVKGEEISDQKLSLLFLRMCEMGAQNINLVNPTHFTANIVRALDMVKHKLNIPVVWNTGGYEKDKTIRALSGYVDIFLPDLKYVTPEISYRYSGAENYFDYAKDALAAMFDIAGYPVFDKNGMMKSGVLVRHLVLPSNVAESKKVIDHLCENYDTEKLWLSLMSQYFPTHKAADFPEINRRLTSLEYNRVCEYAKSRGIKNGFFQQRDSSDSIYVPEFSDKVF